MRLNDEFLYKPTKKQVIVRSIDEYKLSYWLLMKLKRFHNNLLRVILPSIRRRIAKLICQNSQSVDWDVLPIQKHHPEAVNVDSVVAAADMALQGVFDVLGSGPVQTSSPPWHTDIISGYHWKPGAYYLFYPIIKGNNSDIKIPWEISRMHPLLVVGQAYQLTKDEKYARFFVWLVSDWIQRNPLRRSVNWRCAMDVAIRAVNIMWAYRFFEASPSLTDESRRKILTSLYEHGYHIRRELEKAWKYNHNHYLSDLCGLMHLGLLFEEVGEGKKWLEFAKHELFTEIRLQILPTGSTYERSINYHRLVTEICLVSILLLHRNGHEIPLDISYRLHQMLLFIAAYLKPNGMAPVIGDQDDGRLLPFDQAVNLDHRYLLCTGAILYNDPYLKARSERFWTSASHYIGVGAKTAFDLIPDSQITPCSQSFPDAGFYIMKHDDNYIFINNSGQGRYPEVCPAAHTHSDILSFELVVNGHDILVDTGSYVYSPDPEARVFHRSTKMHNTATVDGLDQNKLSTANVFWFQREAVATTLRWNSTPTRDEFEGEHDGFTRLPDPVVHRRSIVLDKKPFCMNLCDSFTGSQEHRVCLHFHFAPEVSVEEVDEGFLAIVENTKVKMMFESENPIEAKLEDSFVSRSYGSRQQAQALTVLVSAVGAISIRTKITCEDL
ncbi:MAG: heparinase II/III family protein [Candidatus Cloacimonetes bacterium]|nr:heparinase II/III family protein [Candidatus Cloacimonadota bacterium]